MGNKIYLWADKENQYKSNLHCHTTVSDGKLTPEEIKRIYKEQGYQVVAYTDHRKYVPHTGLTDEDFVALCGVEVDMNEIRLGKERIRTRMYHINFYDTNPEIMAKEKAEYCVADYWNHDVAYVNSYIEKMDKLGFLACYNHPYWSMHTAPNYLPLKGLFAMEIYNHNCELEGMYGYTPQVYDEMLRAGHRICCMATDDNHNEYEVGNPLCDSFGGYTVIQAKELTYQSIISSLREGKFYSSMGPQIKEISIEDDELYIRTSPVEKIYIHVRGKNCCHEVAAKGDTLTEARFKLKGNEYYLRVTVKDSQSRFADSNAYFLDQYLTLQEEE